MAADGRTGAREACRARTGGRARDPNQTEIVAVRIRGAIWLYSFGRPAMGTRPPVPSRACARPADNHRTRTECRAARAGPRKTLGRAARVQALAPDASFGRPVLYGT